MAKLLVFVYPVPYKWKYEMEAIDLEKEDISKIVYEVVNAKVARQDNKDKRAPKRKNANLRIRIV